VAASAGNHALGLAYHGAQLGVRVTVVMPTTAPAVKVEGCKGYGAEVIMAGTTSLDRQARAETEARDRGLTMVPPFDHRLIVIGQGTTGLEILEQCPDVGTVFVPAGGGGLVSGVATAIKLSNPSVRVVAVEPAGAPKMTRSLAAGHPVTLDSTASIADGLMNLRPGDITFAHVQKYVDEVATVGEADIAAAVSWLFKHARIVAEPSGAITTAAVHLGLGHATGKVVAIVTGGNVAPEKFAQYIGG
jgi:threonine dehydratase